MKKGFTLAELLAVTVLLALIVTIAYPVLFNSFEEQEQELDEAKQELIYNAAENYVKLNANLYPYSINTEACVFLKDLIDENLVAVELDKTFENRIVKVKMLENNQYSSTILDIGEQCNSNGTVYQIKKCNVIDESTSSYELKDNRTQYIKNDIIIRQIDNIEGKNLDVSSTVSYDNMVNNYNNLHEVLKYKDLYYSKFNKGKEFFKMIVDIDMRKASYNTFTTLETEALTNASIFYNNGIDTTCDE